ncbi:hypothetical protein GCM10025857_35480 [Alicyclobacillus contaminans]|nr:hypothetical protein GCM10025857_35480 [Alicyclobacillus contaminans]
MQDETEVDHKPMYFVWLSGHFSDGKAESDNLSFSILADGSEAWAITDESGAIHADNLFFH